MVIVQPVCPTHKTFGIFVTAESLTKILLAISACGVVGNTTDFQSVITGSFPVGRTLAIV